jgi:ubiquinone/menaquinone biosynthesis C-methylase UbiE
MSMRCVPAVLLLLLSAPLLRADEFIDDVKRLVPAIGLRAGQTVADIGGGQGQLTVALAKELGESGHVFSTEIGASGMERIRRAAADAGLRNVTVLEAHPARTNLPAACCDAVVIRYVYHHFAEPRPMNRSVFESVKPGGHVVVIDFEPRKGPTASPEKRADEDSHGVDAETVVKELTEAGFERVSVTSGDERRGFLAVMRKPV